VCVDGRPRQGRAPLIFPVPIEVSRFG
jgi:hypothetical protein